MTDKATYILLSYNSELENRIKGYINKEYNNAYTHTKKEYEKRVVRTLNFMRLFQSLFKIPTFTQFQAILTINGAGVVGIYNFFSIYEQIHKYQSFNKIYHKTI